MSEGGVFSGSVGGTGGSVAAAPLCCSEYIRRPRPPARAIVPDLFAPDIFLAWHFAAIHTHTFLPSHPQVRKASPAHSLPACDIPLHLYCPSATIRCPPQRSCLRYPGRCPPKEDLRSKDQDHVPCAALAVLFPNTRTKKEQKDLPLY